MTGKRTLVAYVTKGGVTGDNAGIIAGVLRDDFAHQVDVVDLKRQDAPDPGPYDNVVVGAGVHGQRYYRRIDEVLRDERLGRKPVAIFVTCAGAYYDPDSAREKYMGQILSKFPHLRPVSTGAFGGPIPFGRKEKYTDPKRVRAWARELGEALEG